LLRREAWVKFGQGFQQRGDVWICESGGGDYSARLGLSQHVWLHQQQPDPILAIAASKAEGVEGPVEGNYAVYLDIQYQDGTPLYGQQAAFAAGSHDWQERRVLVIPEKPVRSLSMYLLFRNCRGKVYFKEPRLFVIPAKEKICFF